MFPLLHHAIALLLRLRSGGGALLKAAVLILMLQASTAIAEDSQAAVEAYQEIPHRRTMYSIEKSTLPREHSLSLEQMFLLTDRAVVQRVGTLLWFQSGGSSGKTASSYNSRIRKVISEFDFLVRPRELAPVRDLIVSAIEDQQEYFRTTQDEMQKGGAFVHRGLNDPFIASSHKKLRKALALLQKMYPKESAHNRQSFIDHLGALDFVQNGTTKRE